MSRKSRTAAEHEQDATNGQQDIGQTGNGELVPVDPAAVVNPPTTPNTVTVAGSEINPIQNSDLDLSRCRTSLDLNTPDARFKLFNCTGVSEIELPDNGSVEIRAADWLIHRVNVVDEDTGELREYDRLVLIADDGRTFATTSEVVIARLFQLLSLFDGVHFQGNPRLVITQKTARRTRRVYHDLRVAL